jgi:hypothetical protein
VPPGLVVGAAGAWPVAGGLISPRVHGHGQAPDGRPAQSRSLAHFGISGCRSVHVPRQVEGHVSAEPFAIQANGFIEFSPDILQNLTLPVVRCLHGLRRVALH